MKRTVLIVTLSILMLGAMCHRTPEYGPGVGRLAGMVTDSLTKEPLIGVSVRLAKSRIGTITDEHGKYAIERIPCGKYEIDLSRVGYEMKRLSKVAIAEKQTTVLDCQLMPMNLDDKLL